MTSPRLLLRILPMLALASVITATLTATLHLIAPVSLTYLGVAPFNAPMGPTVWLLTVAAILACLVLASGKHSISRHFWHALKRFRLRQRVLLDNGLTALG